MMNHEDVRIFENEIIRVYKINDFRPTALYVLIKDRTNIIINA